MNNQQKAREILDKGEKATKGPWNIGRTLMTAQTKKWSAEEIADNDVRERLQVFSNFSALDEGRSRELVCRTWNTINSDANAQYIASLSPDTLLPILKEYLEVVEVCAALIKSRKEDVPIDGFDQATVDTDTLIHLEDLIGGASE